MLDNKGLESQTTRILIWRTMANLPATHAHLEVVLISSLALVLRERSHLVQIDRTPRKYVARNLKSVIPSSQDDLYSP